jgi:hypothetical protein
VDYLERRVGFAGPRGHHKEYAILAAGDSLDCTVYRHALVVARRFALGFEIVFRGDRVNFFDFLMKINYFILRMKDLAPNALRGAF